MVFYDSFLDQCAFQRSDINTVYQPEGLFIDIFLFYFAGC